MTDYLIKHIQDSFKQAKNWKGIQDFIKNSLSAMFQVLNNNSMSIKQIQKEISHKPHKNQILTMLGSKLSISEFPILYDRYNNTQKIVDNKIKKIESQIKKINEQFKDKIEQDRLIIQRLQKAQKSARQKFQINKTQKQKDIILQFDHKFSKLENDLVKIQLQFQDKYKRLDKLFVLKADRIQIQNLCKLNHLFQKQLQQMSKGLIDLSKNPFPDVTENLNKKYKNVSQQLSIYNQKIQLTQIKFQTQINKIHNQYKMKFNQLQQNMVSKIKQIQMNFKNNQEKQRDRHQYGLKNLLKSQQVCIEFNKNLVKRIQKVQQTKHNNRISHSNQQIQIKNRIEIVQGILSKQVKQKLNQLDNQTKQILCVNSEVLEQIKYLKQKISNEFNSKVQKSQLKKIIDTKLDIDKYQSDQQNLVFRGQLNQQISEVSSKYSILIKKIDNLKDQFLNFKINQSKLNQSFSNAIENKITLQDLNKITTNLVSIDDLKLFASQIQQKIQSSHQIHKFQQFISDQSVINQTLCSENIIGRWVWRSGQLKNGNLIPWQKQIINTLPQNFIWEEAATALTISNNGLYKIEIGFYSKKKPTIQILVNGNTIVSAVNNSSYVIHHSSGKLKDKTNTNGVNFINGCNITGLTLVDYFLLPSKARIAISYMGEQGEGFISLKRL